MAEYLVDGLVDLQKSLRSIDAALPRQLRIVGNTAAELIDVQARRNASTPLERKAVESLRVASDQRSVALRLGGRRHPFALGAEFGAIAWPQFKPWTGNSHTGGGSGYFLYPAIRSEGTKVLEAYLDGVGALLHANGFT